MSSHRNRRVWTRALGCQMNKLDSQLVLSQVTDLGYEPTDRQAEADLLIFHTCSVREHAEQRAMSLIGETATLVGRRPDTVVAVVGCMAQRLAGVLAERAPHVRLVVGTRMLAEFGRLLQEVLSDSATVVATGEGPVDRIHRAVRFRQSPFQAYVSIMRGCDNFCSYCVVPHVRGRAASRRPASVCREVEALVADGVREVTLLGQNVDAYGRDLDGEEGLAALLRRLHEIPGLARLRFVTSHPRDMTDELLRTVADLPEVCPYLHVPAQSGSDAVLRRMRRGYTSARYLEVVEQARDRIPDVTLASDFIVGFPGETEEDFARSVALVRRCRFKNSFIFKYSPRPGTRAAHLSDDVPMETKRRRNHELLAVQEEVSLQENRQLIGRRVEVLVEGPSKRDPRKLTGRDRGDRVVCFPGGEDLVGREVTVRVTEVTALTLLGEFAR
jgi:tRNA-2-methylthio-N6-dimethylallyladenosine synthase